jgi:hypothetical protein
MRIGSRAARACAAAARIATLTLAQFLNCFAIMVHVSWTLLRLAVMVTLALVLLVIDARVLIPFAVLGFFLLAGAAEYVRSRRPQTWECNDEP